MIEGKRNYSQRDRGYNNSDLSVGREEVLYQGEQRERIQPNKVILRRRRANSGKSISKYFGIDLVLGNRKERQNNEVTKMKYMKFQIEYNESVSHITSRQILQKQQKLNLNTSQTNFISLI